MCIHDSGWGLELKIRLDIRGNTHSKFTMSQVWCVLSCSPAIEDISLGRIKNSSNHSIREFFLESYSYHVISKYEQSYWLSRFAESASPRFPLRVGSGNETT